MSFTKVLFLSTAVSFGANTMYPLSPEPLNEVHATPQISIPNAYQRIINDVEIAQHQIIGKHDILPAISKLETAAEQGNADAMYMLSAIYNDGDFVEYDQKKSHFYLKQALFNGWTAHEAYRLQSSEQYINDTTEALDSAIVQMPIIMAKRINSLAKHGTSSILVGDPELKEDEDLFAKTIAIAINGIARYMVSDMVKKD